MRTWVKTAVALCTAPLLVVSLAGVATAADRWTYRSTSETATTQWTEFGLLPGGVQGNIHVGFLEVYGGSTPQAFGSVADWTCPEGELPPDGGGHGEFVGAFEGEEPPETNCELHSERFIFAEAGQIEFTLDRKLGSARLTGTLSVEDHATGAGGQPPVDITWTGIGTASSYSTTGKFTEGGSTYYYKESGTQREAAIAAGSFIGAMGFTDDADDTSSGQLSRGRYYERSTS